MPPSNDNLAAARARIATAYDPAVLEAAGTRMMGTLAAHFDRVEGRDSKVLNWAPPEKLVAEARRLLEAGEVAAATVDDFTTIAQRVAQLATDSLSRGQNLHSPHYVGHQVPAPVPLAALFDMLGSATNQV